MFIKECEFCKKEVITTLRINQRFCSCSCKNRFLLQNPEYKEKWKSQGWKKGYIPWNKNKFISNPKGRQQTLYRRLILEISDKPCCIRCGFEGKLVVHHKDKNVRNNDWLNLEPLCYSCHNKEHKVWQNFGNLKIKNNHIINIHKGKSLIELYGIEKAMEINIKKTGRPKKVLEED